MSETNEYGQPVGDEAAGEYPRPTPEPTVLEGRYVRVKPLSSADFAELYAALCGPDDAPAWTYLPAPMPANLPAFWMHMAARSEADPTYVIVPQGGDAAGVVSLCSIRPEHGSLELGGVLFGAPLQRTRAATEAIHLLLAHAFDDLGYRRVEWKCDRLNEPSRRTALRFGFAHEGRFRDHMVVKGRRRDTDWFAVTAEDWPRVRAAHERWLDPGNFDDEGRQLSSLTRERGRT